MGCYIRSLTTYLAPLAPLFISSGVESANRMPATPCMWAYRHDQNNLLKFKVRVRVGNKSDFYITFNAICFTFYTWLCFCEPTSIPSVQSHLSQCAGFWTGGGTQRAQRKLTWA